MLKCKLRTLGNGQGKVRGGVGEEMQAGDVARCVSYTELCVLVRGGHVVSWDAFV
jgi:hypothetical protein